MSVDTITRLVDLFGRMDPGPDYEGDDYLFRVLQKVITGENRWPTFLVGGWPAPAEDRQLLADATSGELHSALTTFASQFEVKAEASLRGAQAAQGFLDRFGDQFRDSGQMLGEFVASLPADDQAEAHRLLEEMSSAELASGGKTGQDLEADWLAGRCAVVERDDDGQAVSWRPIAHLDAAVLAKRARMVAMWEDARQKLAEYDAEGIDPESKALFSEAAAKGIDPDDQDAMVAYLKAHASEKYRERAIEIGMIGHVQAAMAEGIDDLDRRHGIPVDAEGRPV